MHDAFDIGTPGNEAISALRDNHVTPPPDAAAFRIDFPAWLANHTDRNRRIALAMMLRRDWARFHGEQVAA
jgi:hypothetical protein